ncbi:MAG TPA: mechanosensitive ion channel domain-containing protein, partial [Vicinamibacteria bacterium]|nr:mechanosensitive ion channel domain-containing protein [Vicinamibacteria bacterium]
VSLTVFLVMAVLVVVGARLVGNAVGGRLLARSGLEPGLRYALGRMTFYALLVVGLLIALQTAGIQVGSVTVVLGALGVGIGFGLQNIVNNFVSGLILLAERPVRVGDWIEVGGQGGRVERIGARSTTIITNDNITIIVPNADLVTQSITNWSHGDPRVRIRLGVGVAYGSDLPRVQAALLAAAGTHPGVLPDPPPSVHLINFGDSALEMELAVWTREQVFRQRLFRGELNLAIEARFREAGIQIPFPQRDLHLRSGGPV